MLVCKNIKFYCIFPKHFLGTMFEWESDNFACEKLKKTKGLMRFFERVQYKEDKSNAHFDMVDAMIKENEKNGQDGSVAMMASQFERFYYKAGKFYRWLYESQYGSSPSPAERIENAKRIAEQQEKIVHQESEALEQMSGSIASYHRV